MSPNLDDVLRQFEQISANGAVCFPAKIVFIDSGQETFQDHNGLLLHDECQ